MSVLYSKVEKLKDISRINCTIRDEMLQVNSASELTDLKKRSDYLVTLTYSPFWKKRFKEKIEQFRELALEENRVTVKLANLIAQYKNFKKEYHPWKKELNIEEELQKIPQHIINELSHKIFEIKKTEKILEFLREEFCDIRKALILCKKQNCIEKLKRANDILALLPFLPSFNIYFEGTIVKEIKTIIEKETKRVITLANIISEVNNWNNYYETKSFDEIEDTLDSYLKKLLEEEKKADTYIPTEAKYKKGASVLWLVYWHKKRKREFAKRIYFPKEFRIISIEGPSNFINKAGNEVYGLKITYESKVKATTLKIRGKEIKLKSRWIKREKVIPLPQEAINIRLIDKKPKSAMDIA